MVSLLVDTAAFLDAGTQARSVAQSVERALSRATSGFATSAQMAGSDPHGLTWAEAYDKACGQIFSCTAQLQDAAGALARKLSATGYYYELTELANAGLTDVAVELPAPIQATSCPYVPSAAGGERKFPNAGNPVFEWVAEQIANLVGDMWPDGDTGKLDHASTVWHRLADDLDDAASNLSHVGKALDEVDTPELPTIHDEIAKIRSFSKKLATACRALGKACNDLSGKIAHVHLQTEITLGITITAIAVTVGAGLGLTVVTFGISDAAAAGGVAAEVAGAVSTIGGFIAELASTISVGVGLIAESAAGLVGISADLATTIGVTVGDISAGAVLWGAAGAVENVVVTGIAEPGGDLVGAAEDGFVGGAIGGAVGGGIVKTVQVLSSGGRTFLVTGISNDLKADILAMAKGTRPDPSTYLRPQYIADHLAQFEGGATRFVPQAQLAKYGLGQSDGTVFVMARSEVEKLVRQAGGDQAKLEQSLGLEPGQLGGDIVRVDIDAPLAHGGRIPSGNEAGANAKWEPSGLLPTGIPELVIESAGMLPGTDYYAVSMEIGHPVGTP